MFSGVNWYLDECKYLDLKRNNTNIEPWEAEWEPANEHNEWPAAPTDSQQLHNPGPEGWGKWKMNVETGTIQDTARNA